jgi:hypothetical protein
MIIKKGTTSKIIPLFIRDSTSTSDAGLSGLTFSASGLTCYYRREDSGNNNATQIVLATMTRGSWVTSGFVAMDDNNLPGHYEFGVPNALLTSGAKWTDVELKGATNMFPCRIRIDLNDGDRTDAMTESYATCGTAPTLEQSLFEIMQFLHAESITGTTLTAKRLDGATTAMTFTLDSSASPTSITRSS